MLASLTNVSCHMKYIIIDTANLFFRAKHVGFKQSDPHEKVGMALHITLNSVNKVAQKFGADHVVFALEGRSWRKDFYKPYKANRAVDTAALTQRELEEDQLFWSTYEDFTKFLTESTNTSVIRSERAEADDVIARFINLHPNDDHYIISGDTDFDQLISQNVKRYDGINNQLITIDGYFDDQGNRILDKKTKEHKVFGDPRYILFEKCMRGDTTDNVFSAYPGIRSRGTSKRYGLAEAYADIDKQGFVWNNVMLHRWVDHEGIEHCVRDDYQRNRILIDLNAQPEDIKEKVDTDVKTQLRISNVSNVGIYFLRFCGRHELVKISETAERYLSWMNKPYTGTLKGQS